MMEVGGSDREARDVVCGVEGGGLCQSDDVRAETVVGWGMAQERVCCVRAEQCCSWWYC